MTFFYDLNKKLADLAKPAQQLNEGGASDYSAKAARAGQDIGKPGKQFAAIAKSAGQRYGSAERGKKVAGAVLAKLRGKNGSATNEEYGPLEEKNDGNLANNAKPYDKVTRGDVIAGRLGKDEMGGKTKRVKEADMEESALQAYLGKKKYGDAGMKALQKAGREGAGKEKMDKIRDKFDKVDEQDVAEAGKPKGGDWDAMMKDVEARKTTAEPGQTVRGHKHDIEHTATGRIATRRADAQGISVGADDDAAAEPQKRGRGRPKGTGKAIGAKGPSGKSKLMARESGDNLSDDIQQAMATLKKAGYKVTKAQEELDEKAVSVAPRRAAGIAHAAQKGEIPKSELRGASKEMAKMSKGELHKFAATKEKNLPKKKSKEVEETADEATPSKSKGGMQFGKGIYDSMNRELEQMIAESMNISMNVNSDAQGAPTQSLTVTATDEDAMALGQLLKMAGMGHSDDAHDCGSPAEQVDENQPDWPTNTEQSNDALQYAGGLNKPKSTGQTTVPVIAGQLDRMRTYEDQELDEQEQVMAPESKDETLDEELKRIREMAGIREAAKPDYIDLDKDGDREETMKKAAADKKADDKKVEESILSMTNLWRAYKG